MAWWNCISLLFPNICSQSYMFLFCFLCVPQFACLIYHKVEIPGFYVMLHFCNFFFFFFFFFKSLQDIFLNLIHMPLCFSWISSCDKWGGFHESESQRRWWHLSIILRNIQTHISCSTHYWTSSVAIVWFLWYDMLHQLNVCITFNDDVHQV